MIEKIQNCVSKLEIGKIYKYYVCGYIGTQKYYTLLYDICILERIAPSHYWIEIIKDYRVNHTISLAHTKQHFTTENGYFVPINTHDIYDELEIFLNEHNA